VTAAQLEDLALSALGLYFVVSVVPDLSGLATGLINLREMGDTPEIVAAFRNNVGVYLGTLAQLVIGAYLCFKGYVLGEFLRKQRSPKTRGPQELTSQPRCPACGTPFDPSHYAATTTDPRCSSCHEPLPRSFFGSA
jgi:hypothetical protein